MFTYSKPDFPATTTRRSVEYRGKREVYHAKQHGTAVGFIGSGMTSGYGRLNYNELVRLLTLRVIEEVKAQKLKSPRRRRTQKPLSMEQHREIRQLGASLAIQLGQPEQFEWQQNNPDRQRVEISVDFQRQVKTSTALLEVLTELAQALGDEDMLAREVARLFRSRPLDQFDARLRLVGGSKQRCVCAGHDLETTSVHGRWITSVFLNDKVIRKHIQGEKRKLQKDQREIARAIFEDPDTTRLIEVFQTAFESRRRDFAAETMAQDCMEAFTAAYQSAMRSIDVTVSDTHALDWYRSLERAFKKTRRRDGSLYDPYGPRTNLPEMRQIVLSAWSVLANAKPKDRNDAYRAVFFSLGHIRNLDDVALKDWPDPIDSTVRSLGLTRLLTVNYDHELERYFRRRFGFTFSDFEVDPSDAQGLPSKDETDEDRQTFYNGSGVRLVRAEMQKTSVSELLDFAIPHDEDMHLYYLHGRASDAETTKRDDVILAERDYQRHYLENTVVRRGFDESLRALFAANTVIFLGIGMSEGDLLRPLREFVSDDQKWRRTSGGPIAIMNSGKPQEDESKVAEFNVNFGAKTIFYETYVDLVDRSPAIEGDDSDTATGDDISTRVNLTDISGLKSKVEKILDSKKTPTDWPRLNKAEKEALDRVQRLVSNVLHLAPLQPVWDKDGLLFLHTMLSRLETYVMTASLDRFLKQITPKHAEWLGEWTRLPDQRMARFVDWKGDFRCEETLWIRQRIKHGLPETEVSPEDCPHFEEVRDKLSADQPNPYVEMVFSGGEEADSPVLIRNARRVARICGPRGIGKGSLIHALQQPEAFRQLFPVDQPLPPEQPEVSTGLGPAEQPSSAQQVDKVEKPCAISPYVGAFFADARYSTEFNSVITALARFIAGRRAELDPKNQHQTEKKKQKIVSDAEIGVLKDGTQARVEPLRKCFHVIHEQLEGSGRASEGSEPFKGFKELAEGKRLLICLSGVERLFRAEGAAYQAIHGAFFRFLLGEELARQPIDLVLIVGAESVREATSFRDLQHQLPTVPMTKFEQDAEDPLETDPLSSAVRLTEPETVSRYDDGASKTALCVQPTEWVELGIQKLVDPEKEGRQESLLNPCRPWIIKNLRKESRALEFFRNRIAVPWITPDAKVRTDKSAALSFLDIQTLCKMLEKNTGLVMWFLHLLDEILPITDDGVPERSNGEVVSRWRDLGFQDGYKGFLRQFEVAAHGGEAATIEEIMRCYRSLDEPRRTGATWDGRPSAATIRDEIMRHLAFFSVPVERAVLACCPEIAKLAFDDLRHSMRDYQTGAKTLPNEREVAKWLQPHLETLYKRRLIIQLHAARPRGVHLNDDSDQRAHIRYFLHSRVREHISRQMNFDLFEVGEHSFFNLSLYGAQPKDMPSPRTHDYRFVGEILHRLIYLSRTDVQPFFKRSNALPGKSLEQDEKEREPWRESKITAMDSPLSPTRRARAAQSLLAGSFSVGVITRFDNLRGLPERMWEHETPFDNYSNWLRSLSNIANAIDFTEKKYCKSVRKVYGSAKDRELDAGFNWAKCKSVTRPFYPNEVAWLYNERGLGKLVQGKISESLALFNQAETLQRTLRWVDDDANGPTGSSLRILALNKAVALIEAGRAEVANNILKPIAEYENIQPPKQGLLLTPYLALGYMGLINHLQGRLKRSEALYGRAIRGLQRAQAPRGSAIFHKHLGDLKRGLRLFGDADELIRRAIAEAKSTRQMDVFHMARISLARVEYAREGTLSDATFGQLNEASTYSDRLGIPKLRVEVDTLLASSSIGKHDLEAAGERLVRAIALSSRHSMNLRKIAAVQTYLSLAEARQDTKLVKRMRRKLSDLTEKFDYQLPSDRSSFVSQSTRR